MTLYIYGTVYNNINRLLLSLESFHGIEYEKMFIVDNFSNDGTYEFLKINADKYRLELNQIKCNRGRGRQLAMEMAMKVARDSDYLMTVDFDTIYEENLTTFVNSIIEREYRNCIFNNYLSLKKYNSEIPWKNLNNGEDLERYANFASRGFYLLIKDVKYQNEPFEGSRDRRYAHGIKYYIRAFTYKVDLQRSWCFKSFSQFYRQINNMKYRMLLIYLFSKFKTKYCYDKNLNNSVYTNNKILEIDTVEDIESILSKNI